MQLLTIGLAAAALTAAEPAPDAPSCYDFAVVGAVTDQRYIDTPAVPDDELAWFSRYGWSVEVNSRLAGDQPPERFRAIATHHAMFRTAAMQDVLMFVRHIDGADVIIFWDRDPEPDPERQARRLTRDAHLRQCGPQDRTIKAYVTP